MNILVTGASIVYALPVIRHLGRLGHTVTVSDAHPHAAGLYSRYAAARWRYPPVSGGAADFRDALRAWLRDHPQDMVLPLFEEAIPLSGMTDVRAPLGSYDQLMGFHDKALLYRFAREIGVPTPPTVELSGEIPAGFRFPAVLKVPQSSAARGVLRVNAAREVAPTWERMAADHRLPAHVRPLLQQAVDAESLCVLGYAHRGAPKGLLVYRNLCEYPRSGGGGVVRESVRHPEVERHALALMRAARWHGPVGFDFLVERGTGAVFLIDANPRLTPGAPLAVRAGFDLVAMMTSEREPEDIGVVEAGHANVTEPMALSWALECLSAGPSGWSDLRRVIGPMLRARGDVFDRRDLASLRALPMALIDFARASGGANAGGLEMIRHAQYADHDHGRREES